MRGLHLLRQAPQRRSRYRRIRFATADANTIVVAADTHAADATADAATTDTDAAAFPLF